MLSKKLRLIVLALLSFNAMNIHAQTEQIATSAPWSGMSVGVDVGSIAGHLVHGLRVASPSFFNDIARATLSGYLGWAQNVMSVTDTTYSWLPYGLFKLGIHVGSFIRGIPVRIASFADVAMVAPSLKISSQSVIFGLDGGVDVEIYTDPQLHHAIFIDLGGIGLFSPIADGLKGKPSFANGFTTSFGYRYYF